MAQDNRKIRNAVRFSGTLYKAGMEDELEAALSGEQIQRLSERGSLEGFTVKRTKSAPVETKTQSETSSEIPSESELSKLSKAKLVAIAEERNIEVTPDTMTNKEIIAAITGSSST